MIKQMPYKNYTVRQFINEYEKHFKNWNVYFLHEITPDNYKMYREKNKKYNKEYDKTFFHPIILDEDCFIKNGYTDLLDKKIIYSWSPYNGGTKQLNVVI